MQDRVPLYPGRVKLTPVAGQENTYDMVRADQPTQAGTPLNKDSLLKDATAALFGLGADAVPDDVFVKISEMFGTVNDSLDSQPKIAYAKTTGKSVTFPFSPGYVVASFFEGTGAFREKAIVVASGETVKYDTNAQLKLIGATLTSQGSNALSKLRAIAFLIP